MIQLDILATAEVEAIQCATLRILAEVGIVLPQVEALEILKGAGAIEKEGRIYLPAELIEQEIAKCPPKVTFGGLGIQIAQLGDGILHWHDLGGAQKRLQFRSGIASAYP